MLASFGLDPGADSGWRTTPGTAVIAVTAGAVSVHDARDCTAQVYPAGQAAVISAGRYFVRTEGTAATTFAVAFLGLQPTSPMPMAEGPGEAAPPGCEGTTGYVARHHPAVRVLKSYRATLVTRDSYGPSPHAAHAGHIEVEPGTDVLGSAYRIEPGFSTGWFRHGGPVIQVITRGSIAWYEEQDGQCVETSRMSAGQANIQASPHAHLAAVQGNETLEFITFTFNLPHGTSKPVIGSQAEATDFTPLPPAGCPRLR